MSPEHGHEPFQSVDWDDLSEKRNWADTLWTAAAVLVILFGFIGGMVFRTSITEGPGVTEDPATVESPVQPPVQSAEQSTAHYTGS